MSTVRVVALLRGINVGRNKRVAMAALREVLVGLGYSNVVTYLQSGNAVFDAPTQRRNGVAAAVKAAVKAELGVESDVITRTAGELSRVLDTNPLGDVADNPSRYLVGFLAARPSAEAAKAIQAIDVAPDQIRLVGQEVYLWCPAGLLASPLTKLGWERMPGVAVTTRNWNTVTKLAALASAPP